MWSKKNEDKWWSKDLDTYNNSVLIENALILILNNAKMKKLKLALSTATTIGLTIFCISLITPTEAVAKMVPGYEMINYRCPNGTELDRCNYADDECDVSAQDLCP